jgi:uncharacterized protein YndB with AHSA1/START domain
MSIHHEVVLPAAPERVYEVLTDGAKFTAATGGRTAEIGAGEGAAFSLFGGPIHGRHIELVPGQRVVQAWRTRMWGDGQYSIVRFTLTPDGKGTRLAIDHDGYPAEQHDHLSGGWIANYVDPLTKHFS